MMFVFLVYGALLDWLGLWGDAWFLCDYARGFMICFNVVVPRFGGLDVDFGELRWVADDFILLGFASDGFRLRLLRAGLQVGGICGW